MDAVKGENIEEMNDVAAKLSDVVWARRYSGLAVAGGVVAEDPELLGEIGKLRIPHVEVGAERIGEEQGGSLGGAIELVAELSVGKFGEGHSRWSFVMARPEVRGGQG